MIWCPGVRKDVLGVFTAKQHHLINFTQNSTNIGCELRTTLYCYFELITYTTLYVLSNVFGVFTGVCVHAAKCLLLSKTISH